MLLEVLEEEFTGDGDFDRKGPYNSPSLLLPDGIMQEK